MGPNEFDHVSHGEGMQLCAFPVTGKGHRRVTEPKGYHIIGRNLGMIPNRCEQIVSAVDLTPAAVFYMVDGSISSQLIVLRKNDFQWCFTRMNAQGIVKYVC